MPNTGDAESPGVLEVDTASPVPAYEQLRSQLSDMILSGTLAEGHRLPPIRQLAADLGLAPGTVARVYSGLEAAGLVTSRVRHGTVVASGRGESRDVIQRRSAEAAREFALAVRRLGLGLDDALDAVSRGWSSLDHPPTRDSPKPA